VIGFAFAGYALQTFGMAVALIIGGCLALGGVGLVITIRAKASDEDCQG
jgi:hypothetical protein